ncbi:hypothetical protein [Oribacterium sp. NK2B42]|uniref:hypothetical protein n=1 Tax=Oribacterium sp. NK2B42 TaxID=689781 RepID=UPI0003F98FAF|nr:hypothetical protein [Oribacterium sp. NK2B42]
MVKHSTRKMIKRMMARTVILSCLSTNIFSANMTSYAAGAHADVEETMYVNLDHYGSVNKVNVVKGINFNGTESYTDFGKYTNITNMSDGQKPDFKNGSVTWNKFNAGKFYFEGTLDPTSVEVPWTFDITYKLNGVVMDADKIGGQSGLVEMDIDAYPNDKVSDYMKNNMMLLVAVPVDVQKCYSVDAPEAQTTTLGQYSGIVFAALPGQEGHFVLRLGTEKFETVGAVFMMSPGTVGDLSKIKDLKKIKDDFRDDTNAMLDDFDDVLDGVTNVQSQLDLTNQMLANLQSGKDKIHNNAQVIFNGNDVAIQDLRDLQVLLEPLNEDLKTTQWMVYDINSNLNYLDSDLMDASSKLKTLNTRLKQLGNSMSGTNLSNLDIEELKPSAKDAIDSLEDVVSDINKAANNSTKKSNRNRLKASASEIVMDAALDNASDYRDYGELEDNEKSLISAVSEELGDKIKSISKEDLAGILAVADTNNEAVSSDSDNVKAKYIAFIKAYGSKLQTAPQEVGQTAAAAGLDPQKVAVYAYVMKNEAASHWGAASNYAKHLDTLLSIKNSAKKLVNETVATDDEMSSLADSLYNLTDAISNLETENGNLFDAEGAEELIDSINKVISDLDDILDDGGAVAFQTARVVNTLRTTIGDIDGLVGIMNAYYEDIQKTFEDSENVIMEMEKTAADAASALQNVNNTLRSAEPDFSNAADEGLEIGRQAVDNTEDIVDSTKHLKKTGRKLRDTINNKLDEEEADNNFLNMDPDAAKVSLTSTKNQEPTSISIVCRSEEISADDDEAKVLDSEVSSPATTLMQRVKAVFLKMWNAIRSVFGKKG